VTHILLKLWSLLLGTMQLNEETWRMIQM
jgi:hypothetical protein